MPPRFPPRRAATVTKPPKAMKTTKVPSVPSGFKAKRTTAVDIHTGIVRTKEPKPPRAKKLPKAPKPKKPSRYAGL